MSFQLALLQKVRCRFLSSDSGTPVSGIVATLMLGFGESTHTTRVPLGSLCSDAAGYMSFDLKPFIARGVTTAEKLLLVGAALPNGEVNLLDTLLSKDDPNVGETGSLSSMSFVGSSMGNDPDVTFCLVFPVVVADSKEGGKKKITPCSDVSLPSIQSPDVCDYEASPFSFVTQSAVSLGDDCCESLVPASLPVQEHRFYKVVVRREENEADLEIITNLSDIGEVSVTGQLASRAPKLKFAEVLEFKQQWYSLGHSLGEIKYSLALAPGEATQIAIIDWSRQDSAARTDNVLANEYMDHSLKRDRSIEETIDSALKESQGGSSFMAGTSGQATIPLQYVTLSFNHAIGYGVTNSWGNRNLEAESLQDLHDKIRQQSGYTRSLNSTVIVQASQAEQNVLQTRKVANHNHCHALTIQYYEVLRHFKIRTAYSGRRKAILVPFQLFSFTWELALQFRSILESVLIDPSLKKCFDAIFRSKVAPSIYEEAPAQDSPNTTSVTAPVTRLLTKTFDVFTYFAAGNGSSIHVKDGDHIRISATGEAFTGAFATYGPDGHVDLATPEFSAPGLKKFSLIFKIGEGGPWNQGGSIVSDFVADRDGELIFNMNDIRADYDNNRPLDRNLQEKDRWAVEVTYPVTEPADPVTPGTPAPIPVPESNTFSQVADELCAAKLLAHLNGNQGYYNGCVWTLQNPIERRLRLEAALAGHPDLLDAIDDVPLAVSGNYVAFAYDGPFVDWQATRELDPSGPIEDIVTLPTRGVFAEAQLGHCNACEERDPTRMWDWNEMTIETPPEIGGVTPGPRGQTPSITPTQLPGNVIQITQPPQAPDPLGLAAALKVLGTPDIFRDMSGLDEVSSLLETLSQQSSEANIKALAIQAKDKLDQAKTGSDSKSGSGNGGGNSGKTRTPASEPDAAKQIDRMKAIEYAQSKGFADDQTAQDATKGVLGGEEIASSGNALPADYQARKGVFNANASTEVKINKVLALFSDAPFSSASDINQLFASLSSSNISGYVQWLGSRKTSLGFTGGSGYYKWLKGAAAGRPKQFNFNFLPQSEGNFARLWDGIPDMYGPARESINLIEFLALDLATHIEGYGDYAIVSEALREGYGLNYFFEPNWVSPNNVVISKASYNTLQSNRIAGDLFADADFQAAHNQLLPSAATAWRTTDPFWNGADYFATQAPTSISSNETAFIRQADFYKFRGRGYIQTTNRANYRALARLLRKNLDKLPSPLWSLVESWGPENASDVELNLSLTTSRDSDWSNLFEMSGGIVAHLGVRAFSESKSNCLQIDCTKEALDNDGQGTVAFLGNKINGYGGALSAAVTAILVEMYDSLT